MDREVQGESWAVHQRDNIFSARQQSERKLEKRLENIDSMSKEDEENIPDIDSNITTGEDFVIQDRSDGEDSGEEEVPLTPSSAVSLDNEKEMIENLFDNELKSYSKEINEKEKVEEGEVCKICKYIFTKDRIDTDREYVFKIPSRYKPLRIIGEGAYGFVISALDQKRKIKVAIKVIRNVFNRSRAFQKRILREIMLLKHFRSHDNIIDLYDLFPPLSFENFNDVYIVSDLMDTDLSKLLRRKERIKEKHIQYIIYEILKGLKFVHSADVLHRDVKPSNILLNKRMEVKLCDFGLSRGIDFDVKMSTHYVVTRWYRSPELLMMWEKTSKSIDLWSVGCILGEMLSGEKDPRKRVLFKGNGWVDQLKKIVEKRGMPKENELHGTVSAKRYLGTLRNNKYKRKDLKNLYPKASEEVLELLDDLLVFDAEKRMTAEEAMKHKYFEKLYSEDVENEDESLQCDSKPFIFRFSDRTKTKDIKRILYDVVMDWNKENHKYTRFEEAKRTIHVKLVSKKN